MFASFALCDHHLCRAVVGDVANMCRLGSLIVMSENFGKDVATSLYFCTHIITSAVNVMTFWQPIFTKHTHVIVLCCRYVDLKICVLKKLLRFAAPCLKIVSATW